MSVPEVRGTGASAAEPEPFPIEAAPPRPVLTWFTLATLALIYLGETSFQAGVGGSFLDPTIQTLIAWGGMSRNLIEERGEWFRLLTAAFLHGGVAHLAMNSLALFIAGSALEPFIGRLWLAALFLLGALAGGLASITFNAPNIVGVGASGAIMGLFGFFLTIAFRFEKGPVRRAFVINSLGTLLPSTLPALLPAVTGGSGFSIDYAAHGGGAIGGATLGLLLVLIWRREQRWPPLRLLAAAIVLAGLAVLAYGAMRLNATFAEHSFASSLMSDSEQPKTDAEARARADELIAKFPNDPRGYYYKALQLAQKDDAQGMEPYARKAVERTERYPGIFRERFRSRVRMVHALALNDLKRIDEAKAVAAPVCTRGDDEVVGVLRKERLCP